MPIYRTVTVLLLSAIPAGGTVAVFLLAPGLVAPAVGHSGMTVDMTLALAVLWGIVLGWVVARGRGVVLGFIVFGGVVVCINAVAVATMAVRASAW